MGSCYCTKPTVQMIRIWKWINIYQNSFDFMQSTNYRIETPLHLQEVKNAMLKSLPVKNVRGKCANESKKSFGLYIYLK